MIRHRTIPRKMFLRIFSFSIAVAILSLVGLEFLWLWLFVDGLLLTELGIKVLALQVGVILVGLLTLVVDFCIYLTRLRKKR